VSLPDSILETDATPLLASVRAARRVGDVRECERLATECVRVAEACSDALAGFHACTSVGLLRMSRAEPEEAIPYFAGALDLAESARLVRWIGPANHNCFVAARDARNLNVGRKYAWHGLQVYEDRRDWHGAALLAADVQDGRLEYRPSLEAASAALASWRSACLHYACTPRLRAIACANAMSAAALLGCDRVFRDSAAGFRNARCEAREAQEGEDLGKCLVIVALAYCRVGNFPQAAAAAADALTVAHNRGEERVAQKACDARLDALAERVPSTPWD